MKTVIACLTRCFGLYFCPDSSSSCVHNQRRHGHFSYKVVLLIVFILSISEDVFIVRVTSLSNNIIGQKVKKFGFMLEEDVLGTTTTVNDNILDSDSNTISNNDNNQRGYWCEYCSCGFKKKKSYIEHIKGKRCKAVIVEGEKVWNEYLESCANDNNSDSTTDDDLTSTLLSSAFYDKSVIKMDVVKAWSLDLFMEGLQARSRSSKKKFVLSGTIGRMDTSRRNISSSSGIGNNANGGGGNQIDPTIRLSDLSPSKRGALFRYLHESSSGIPGLIDMISCLPPRYVRVKELLESVEVYLQIVTMILKRSTEQGRKAKRLTRVYDIGCGHGLVGMLIAATCPNIAVHSIDLVPRDSYVAQRNAFISTGTALDNLSFEVGDLSLIKNKCRDQRKNDNDDQPQQQQDTGHTLVLCVHGCKELTHESIELAKDNKWAWLSVPCCMQAADHLNDNTSLKIKSDHTRYAMLCGAVVAIYHPDTVSTIDSRITGRGIVLASSGGI